MEKNDLTTCIDQVVEDDMQPQCSFEIPSVYVAVNAQWFFSSSQQHSYATVRNKVKEEDSRCCFQWFPFSQKDSHAIEVTWCNQNVNASVAVQGGRFDVWPQQRVRKAVYWSEEESVVRRCTWYFRPDNQLKMCIPYDEDISDWLEKQYRAAIEGHSKWNIELKLPTTGEVFIFHNSKVLAQYEINNLRDSTSSTGFITTLRKTRVVGRGLNDFSLSLPLDEADNVDHVIFVVHGIGWRCDLSGHTLVECVNRLRTVTQDMMHSHFSEHAKHGRVEFLPVHWYTALHGEDTGLDNHLKSVTLLSVPKLRQYTNDTLVDILFYTSPKFCQRILDQVAMEMCRLRDLFLLRNANCQADFSVAGHSLGSVISFDLLAHQDATRRKNMMPAVTDIKSLLVQLNLEEFFCNFEAERVDLTTLMLLREDDLEKMKLPLGPRKRLLTYIEEIRNGLRPISLSPSTGNCGAGLGQPLVTYPQLAFPLTNLFALGSPISLFLTARGIFALPKDYQLPGCSNFFNIFHPFDPIAYRIESMLVDPCMHVVPCPVLIPHHAGRKRFHLEIKDKLNQVGKEWRNRAFSSYHSIMKSFSRLTRTSFTDAAENVNEKSNFKKSATNSDDDVENEDWIMGSLNGGRRVDYVLQETPFESVNDYLFALSSHLCYWKSEDTALFFLCEIYKDRDLSSVLASTVQKNLTPCLITGT